MMRRVIAAAAILAMSGCGLYYAQAYRVEGGSLKVDGFGPDRAGALAYARESAEYACTKEMKGHAVISEEYADYNGPKQERGPRRERDADHDRDSPRDRDHDRDHGKREEKQTDTSTPTSDAQRYTSTVVFRCDGA